MVKLIVIIDSLQRIGRTHLDFLFYETMAYQVGNCAAMLNGKVDAVALTGGIAYDEMFVKRVTEKVSFIAPIKVYPCEASTWRRCIESVERGRKTKNI